MGNTTQNTHKDGKFSCGFLHYFIPVRKIKLVEQLLKLGKKLNPSKRFFYFYKRLTVLQGSSFHCRFYTVSSLHTGIFLWPVQMVSTHTDELEPERDADKMSTHMILPDVEHATVLMSFNLWNEWVCAFKCRCVLWKWSLMASFTCDTADLKTFLYLPPSQQLEREICAGSSHRQLLLIRVYATLGKRADAVT